MKKIFLLFSVALFSAATIFSQTSKTVLPKNWHLQDKDSTGIYGISLDKAYTFVKSKKLKAGRLL